jgi:hypothetical protein
VAKRSRESFQKRAREKARQEKQAAKREKRQSSSESEGVSRAEEDALMQEFARLSARFESDEISADEFNEERERIFGELGLETD